MYVHRRTQSTSTPFTNGTTKKDRHLNDHHRTGKRPVAQTPISGSDILKARSAKGMTQASLAAKLNVKPAVVRSWEQNRNAPGGSQLANLRKTLNL